MNTPIILPPSITETLAGHVLIASAQLRGSIFERSVIYMCAHDREGAMGVVVNAPVENITLNQILDQIGMSARAGDRHVPVLFGGPVDPHRGFLLHDGAPLQDTPLSQRDGITVTANANVLNDWLDGNFTARMMLALGYAGWSAGQLETEIKTGSWMSIPATKQLVFDTPLEARWDLAIASLGFNVNNLSSTVGHA